jgi:hypothetical protein
MKITSISYFGNDGWENFTDFNYTPSSDLHIPRVGDTIKNPTGNYYKVTHVIWNLATTNVNILCDHMTM